MMDPDEAQYLRHREIVESDEYDKLVFGDGQGELPKRKQRVKKTKPRRKPHEHRRRQDRMR